MWSKKERRKATAEEGPLPSLSLSPSLGSQKRGKGEHTQCFPRKKERGGGKKRLIAPSGHQKDEDVRSYILIFFPSLEGEEGEEGEQKS